MVPRLGAFIFFMILCGSGLHSDSCELDVRNPWLFWFKMAKKRGSGFSDLRTSRSKQAAKAAADALKASRDTALQDLYRTHMGGIKCFNHALGECSGGLEGAHREGMESSKRIFGMLTYRVPAGLPKKIQDLKGELKRTGILCRTCHERYDGIRSPPLPTATRKRFTSGGAKHAKWNDFLKDFKALALTL